MLQHISKANIKQILKLCQILNINEIMSSGNEFGVLLRLNFLAFSLKPCFKNPIQITAFRTFREICVMSLFFFFYFLVVVFSLKIHMITFVLICAILLLKVEP